MRDGEHSRDRLLEAATAEFAAVGIAGARVDRIAEAASVNKAQMYRWYASKDDLFDAVFAQHLDRIVDRVPLTPNDLPGYVVALYDSYLDAPELVRLASWFRLERAPTGDLLATHGDRWSYKLDLIAEAQAAGTIVTGITPADVYALLISIAGTWSPISATFTATEQESAAQHEARRAVLRGVVERALVGGG
ncbi:MAG: TetR family transcriptional regulator [Solirubrobacteraceae bacterium]|nr:TetR family transcriptional regulator [Patulibacter sp.]